MDINAARIFKQIVESGSFQNAAGVLGLQPAVVTRKIAQLENELGQKLMSRSKAGVNLTDAGEIIYRMASNVVSIEKEALQELKGQSDSLQGHITIYTTTGTLNAWLVEDVVEFLKLHPKVNLNILGTNEPLEFVDHKADVIIGPYKKRYEALEKIHIRSYQLKAYASPGYLQKNGHPKSYEELDNHRLLSFSNGRPGSLGDVDWFLMSKTGMRKPYLNINSARGLLKAAELGVGIAFLGKEFIQDCNSELVDVFPSDKGQKIDMYYIFRKSMKSFKRIVSLGNFLHERHKIH